MKKGAHFFFLKTCKIDTSKLYIRNIHRFVFKFRADIINRYNISASLEHEWQLSTYPLHIIYSGHSFISYECLKDMSQAFRKWKIIQLWVHNLPIRSTLITPLYSDPPPLDSLNFLNLITKNRPWDTLPLANKVVPRKPHPENISESAHVLYQ